MGQHTAAWIQRWQEKVGLTPASGEGLEILRAMQREASTLLEVLVLEIAGIRDGDGHWYGADPVGAKVDRLGRLCDRLYAVDAMERKRDTGWRPQG